MLYVTPNKKWYAPFLYHVQETARSHIQGQAITLFMMEQFRIVLFYGQGSDLITHHDQLSVAELCRRASYVVFAPYIDYGYRSLEPGLVQVR